MKKIMNPKLYIFFSIILLSKAYVKANMKKNIQWQYNNIAIL